MLQFIKAFEKTLLVVIKLFMIFILYMIFYRFFADYSAELTRFSRVSVIIATTFFVLCYIMIKLFGSLDFGKRQTRELSLSIIIAVAFTDLFTYCQLCVMEKSVVPVYVFILVVVVHAISVYAIVKLGNDLYFAANPPVKVALICPDIKIACKIAGKVRLYKNRYKITTVADINSDNLYEDIDNNEGVIIANIPVTNRKAIIDYCYKHRKNIYCIPDLCDIVVNNCSLDFFDDSLVLIKNMSGLTFEQRFIKRVIDIVISFVAIIISSPVMLLEALAIKLEDGGSVIFRQKRVTIDGRIFSVYKFRTMTENKDVMAAQKNDLRITKVGSFLRKTRIDELPQMFNILKGDMSIVGPRPEWNELSDRYQKELPEFEYRLKVKAGLTGYAQIMGKNSTLPKDKLLLDMYYIENYSLLLDIKILLQTIITVITPEKSE